MKYLSPITYHSKVIANINVFKKVCQRSRSGGQISWHQWKSLVIRNTHTKYQSPIIFHSKDMASVKVFQK
jgi:hypothetical protein